MNLLCRLKYTVLIFIAVSVFSLVINIFFELAKIVLGDVIMLLSMIIIIILLIQSFVDDFCKLK